MEKIYVRIDQKMDAIFALLRALTSSDGDGRFADAIEEEPVRGDELLNIGGDRSKEIDKILINGVVKTVPKVVGVGFHGLDSAKPYWRCYFPNTQAIIYVVDSSDTDRLVIAKEEFHAILEEEELKGAVVLIFANKQDLPGALDDAAVTEALELHKIKSRQWSIFKTSAIKGEGLFEGLDWLSNTLKSGG
ncbi:hypothetical protein GIB67_018644 [Kingdonia uniflora]|uniref:ADP-ribosylation factor 1 n=1 Tax=Kingdonia uniflora TaxID=39325 RepID=A0A7J7M2J2_9MAGN|nr:hypothetical protein GIB67_018644 [Kingdonia uniflora]